MLLVPLHWLVLDSLDLSDLEQMDAITRDATALHNATLTAMAFHEPKRLQTAEAAVRASVRRFNGEGAASTGDEAALRAYAEAMIAKYSATEVPPC